MQRFLAWDERLSARLRVAEKPGFLRSAAAFFAHSGDSWFWLLALAVVWFAGDAAWKYRALVLAAGILVTAVIVLSLKFTFRRSRPEGDWGDIYRKTDPHSFPSGHAARAFLLPVLAWGVGPGWLFITLMVWGPLVALARVAMGVHYVSDIAAGIVVGVAMGLGVLQIAAML